MLRREFRRVRVQQMQGSHEPGQRLQTQIHGAARHEVGRRAHGRDQLGLTPGQNHIAVRIQGHVTGFFQEAAGVPAG